MNELNDRIVYCIKLWIKELRELPLEAHDWTEKGLIMHLENEILNGEYCSDEEFNHYNRWGKI